MKIRAKLTVLPIIAILLPLLGGIFYVRSTARSYYEKQIGILYLTIAKDMVDELDQTVKWQMLNLNGWVENLGIAQQLEQRDESPLDPAAIKELDAKWSTLKAVDEPLRSILHNPLADQLDRYRKVNPLFAELMLTDREGRLIAATNPTTDYWQADERWWKNAAASHNPGSGWAHNIIYDASAGVQAMDIAFPIRSETGKLLGVVKGSLNAIAVLHQFKPDPWNAEIYRDIVFHDGQLFARLNPTAEKEVLPRRIETGALNELIAGAKRWEKVKLFPGKQSLAACVPVGMDSEAGAGAEQLQPIYVLVHRDYASAIAPVTAVIRTLTWRGSVVVVIIAIVGFVLATVWFARPLRTLRNAALGMAEHVQRREQGVGQDGSRGSREVEAALRQLDSIQTRDEMQDLARVFAHMGKRVLHFNRHLERELTRKTEEISEDLVMAREFQEALLPNRYPQVPFPADSDSYNLNFSHVYRPALSVSGDFFDISEVSKHCVRVFVADVMGHGARSALMTAILHALISDATKDDDSPAQLLQRMNEEFHAIGKRTGETLFVTAAHLLIDTRECVIRYAAAGHTSPLVLDRATGEVKQLDSGDHPAAAAGLFADTVYTSAEYAIEKEQSILLYTDGVTEAENPQHEEFGLDRLVQAVRDAASKDRLHTLPEYLLESLEGFMDTAVAMDDICLVSIDIAKATKR